MKKRILSLLLTVLLLVGSLPIVPVQAAGLQYDADGDGEAFAIEVESKTIQPTDTEFTVDINFVENTGIWAFKFYLVYDKELTVGEGAGAFEKGEAFIDFKPATDVGLSDATHDLLLSKDIDYIDSLANAGLDGISDCYVTTVYSECAEFDEWSTDTGRLCSVTFQVDPASEKDEYTVYAIPATGGWVLREEYGHPNADDFGFVEIFDLVAIPGTIAIEGAGGDEPENTDPTFVVSDAEIAVGTETADFTLEVENNPGFWGIIGYIGYDANMSLASFVNGEIFSDSELALGGPMENETQRDIPVAANDHAKRAFDAFGVSYDGVLATQVFFEPTSFEDNTSNGVLVSFSLDTSKLEAGIYNIGFYYTEDNLFDLNGDSVVFDVVCGTLTVLECDHEYGEGITVDATCTVDGSTTYTCSKCGSKKIDVIAAIGHAYDKGAETKAPTCTETGVWTKVCANGCGIDETTTIDALGHDFDEGTETKAPTCIEAGEKTFACARCGNTYIEEIPVTDHVGGIENTETIDGKQYLVVRCTVCSSIISKKPASGGLKYDKDGDGESFAIEVESKTIQSTDTEFTADINFVENTGVWAWKFFLVYDKELTVAETGAFTKGEAFADFNPATDPGLKNAAHDTMFSADFDYADSLANAGLEGNSDWLVTSIYSECADPGAWSTDTGRLCTVTFNIDPASEKDEYTVYAIPATGGWILREEPGHELADDYGFVEILDPACIPGVITVESNDPKITVSDAEIVVGTETADFTLSINNNPGIWGIVGYINYDENMSLAAFENGEIFADSDLALGGPMVNKGQKDIIVADNRVAKQVYDYIGASYDGVLATQVYFEPATFVATTADGVIANFSLNTAALEVGTYEIAFYFDEYGIIDSNGDSVEFDVVYGTLTVVECAHEYALGGEAFEPTCTVAGQTGYVCTKCGSPERIAPIGHDYDAVVTDPTCIEDGYITKTCKRNCGEKDAVVVEKDAAALGHDYDNGVVSVAPTCTDTGIKTFSCQRCGATYTEAVAAIGHDFDEGKTTIAPTCTSEGKFVRTCKNGCGETKVTPLSALGHDYDDGVVSVVPTCTDTGVKTFTCQRCGDTYTEEIAALGHNYVADTTVAPTCTEEGYTTYSCTRCGDNYIDDYVDALGHDYAEVVTTPTCTETGYTTYTCTRCDDSYIDDYVDALGHDYESVITTPTCLAGGFTTHTCTRCPASYVDSYTDVVDHSWTITNETPIRIDYKCIWCEETYFETFTPAIKVTDATIREGTDSADFELVFEHNPGVYSLYGFIAYDDAATFNSYENGTVFAFADLIEGGPMENIQMRDIPVINDEKAAATFAEHGANAEGMLATKLYYENTGSISNNMNSGVIGTFSLNTAALDPGTYEIVFYYMAENTLDSNETPVEYEVIKGTLTVTPCEHQFSSYDIEGATCTESGYKKGYCSICSKTITLEIYQPCGHDYVAVVTYPTNQSHGFTTHTCSRCNDSYVDTYVLPKFDVNSPNMEISEEIAKLGDTVVVKVTLNNNPGINYFSLSLDYNNKNLELVDVSASVDLGGELTRTANKIEWASATDSTFSGGAAIFLTFNVVSKTSGVFTVSFDYMPDDIKNANGENVAFGIKTGSVKVYPEEMVLGDTNGDGRVTITDVLLVRKYIAGIAGDAELFLENADVDGNGRITITDVLNIRKYIAGIITEFPAEK